MAVFPEANLSKKAEQKKKNGLEDQPASYRSFSWPARKFSEGQTGFRYLNILEQKEDM